MDNKKLNVVLYEPEIANNVGSIMRTCFLADITLHLIEPFGFVFDHRNFARSSANNYQGCDYRLYDDWEDFLSKNNSPNLYFLTRYGKSPVSDTNLKIKKNSLFFVFGKESTGIPKNILSNNINNCFRIPMVKEGRSLNISNAVSIVVYEALRQNDYLDLCKHETEKGADYLEKD